MGLSALVALGEFSQAMDSVLPDASNPPNSGKLEHRKVAHWSEMIQWLGIVVGVVASVAAFVLGQHLIIGAGTILTFQGSIAAYYLNDARYLQTVDQYIAVLRQKVQAVYQQMTQLKELNKSLEVHVKKFDDETKEYQKAIQEANKNLSTRTNELGKVNSDLKKRELELSSFHQLLKPLSEEITHAATQMENQVSAFSEQHGLLKDEIENLKSEVGTLGNHTGRIEEEVDEFDKETDNVEIYIQTLRERIVQLEKLIALQEEMNSSFAAEKKDLSAQIKVADAVDDKILASAQQVHHASDSLGEVSKSIAQSSQDIASLKNLIPYMPLIKELTEEARKRPQEKLSDILKMILKSK